MQEPQAMRVRSLGGMIPWRRVWQSIPVFLPGEFPWAEEPGGGGAVGYSPEDHKESDTTKAIKHERMK